MGYSYVCTARFNQDCIENFFAVLRSKGGWRFNPTIPQFKSAYQNALILSSLQCTSSNTNCLQDSDIDLLQASCASDRDDESFSSLLTQSPTEPTSVSSLSFLCLKNQFPLELFDHPQELMIAYISGWLIRKSKLFSGCISSLSNNSQTDPNNLFIQLKSYTAPGTGLLRPCTEVFHLVHEMESIFRYRFDSIIGQRGIAATIISEIHKKCDLSFLFFLHPEHTLYLSDILVHNFVIMRIFYAIKFCNQKIVRPKMCIKKLKNLMHV